jgi:hypothetical protein
MSGKTRIGLVYLGSRALKAEQEEDWFKFRDEGGVEPIVMGCKSSNITLHNPQCHAAGRRKGVGLVKEERSVVAKVLL